MGNSVSTAAVRPLARRGFGVGFDQRLPYRRGWLDAPAALAGLTQQDRLPETTRDEEKCAPMVALAAAIVSGRGNFERLLRAVEERRSGVSNPRDQKALPQIRAHFEAGCLTTGDLQRFGDAFYRAFLTGLGADDDEIERMLTACGLKAVKTLGSTPAEILNSLRRGELFPTSLVVDGIWHVTLIWKDAAGVVRLYDSDRLRGSQVLTAGTPRFERYLRATPCETLGKKFA